MPESEQVALIHHMDRIKAQEQIDAIFVKLGAGDSSFNYLRYLGDKAYVDDEDNEKFQLAVNKLQQRAAAKQDELKYNTKSQLADMKCR